MALSLNSFSLECCLLDPTIYSSSLNGLQLKRSAPLLNSYSVNFFLSFPLGSHFLDSSSLSQHSHILALHSNSKFCNYFYETEFSHSRFSKKCLPSWKCNRTRTFAIYSSLNVTSAEDSLASNHIDSSDSVSLIENDGISDLIGSHEKISDIKNSNLLIYSNQISPHSSTESVPNFKFFVKDVERPELKDVAEVQAICFHEPHPIEVLDKLLFKLFKAEVHDTLLQKVKYSQPKRHACLIASLEESGSKSETKMAIQRIDLTQNNEKENENGKGNENEIEKENEKDRIKVRDKHLSENNHVIGAVDLTAQIDNNVLKYLNGAEDYLYLSGMAVLDSYRRFKVASALISKVEERSLEWNFEFIVLHVHEDNIGARKLYQKNGFLALSLDSIWSSTLLGRKRRILMAKRTNGYLKSKSSKLNDIDSLDSLDSLDSV